MTALRSRFSNLGVNLALLVFGITAIVLLYALASRYLSPKTDPVRSGSSELVGKIIQVEVRNGCGISGLAADATSFLRRKGFDVVEVGDYTHFEVEESIVVDRIGDMVSARKVAAALGLPEDRVVQEIRQDYFLDASIIIGKDYEIMRPYN